MGQTILQVENVTKKYKEKTVLDAVSFYDGTGRYYRADWGKWSRQNNADARDFRNCDAG